MGDGRGRPKGYPKTGGRQPGSQNKFTVAARTALALAFEGIGGVPALTAWARKNRSDFYKLYARLIPTEVNGQITVTEKPPAVQAVDQWLEETVTDGSSSDAEAPRPH
jgi:hypothetical protein